MAKKSDKLTKYETARILGARALQISEGAPMAIKLSEKDLEEINYDPYKIAKIELEKGKLPIDVFTRQKEYTINEETLKNEAEITKLERELKLQDIDDDDDSAPEDKERAESSSEE